MTGYTVNYDKTIDGVAFNDLYLDKQGNLAFVETSDAEIEETCFHVVQLTQGDYTLDITLGIPYNTYFSSDAPVGQQLKRSITNSIFAVAGVDNIQDFTMALNSTTRKLQVDLIIKLLSGNTIQVNL